MDRRKISRGATLTLVGLLATFLIQCSSDDKPPVAPTQPDNGPPDAPPRVEAGTTIVYTSNKVFGHSHSFQVPLEALQSPPQTGVTGETTDAQGHRHALEITPNALFMAASGQAVKLITGNAASHAHTFTIVNVK